jgi:hypothetical protein
MSNSKVWNEFLSNLFLNATYRHGLKGYVYCNGSGKGYSPTY